MKNILLPVLSLLFAACASGPPEPISRVPHDNPSLTQVRMNPDAHMGREVRWGGMISKVENKSDQTWVEIVRMELRSNGKPASTGNSDGRFIASFGQFLDPVVYEIGKPLTVVGKLESSVRRPIGEFDYLFPVVAVDGSYLWQHPDPVAAPVYPGPWWYYDPWYPYPWPYYHHPHRHFH